MNNTRRLAISVQLQKISDAHEALESIREEEQEYYDNMPESIQQGEKGDNAQTAIDQLETTISSLDEAMSSLENIE